MKNVRIALCQIFILDGDREGNFLRMENAIREAKEQQAEVICFPETSLLGWVNPEAHQRACAIPGEDSQRLGKLAKKYEVFLCAGLAEKEGDKLYDSAILMDPQGQILLKHRKINLLTELMNPPYTPGENIQVVQTPFGRVGILICADTFRDDLLSRIAKLKPDILLVPYGWAAEETQWPEHGESLENIVRNAAQQTRSAVIGTDSVGAITHGPWEGRIFGGQSLAVDKNGRVLVRLTDRDRDVKVVVLTVD